MYRHDMHKCNDDMLTEPGWTNARRVSFVLYSVARLFWLVHCNRALQISRRKGWRSLRYRKTVLDGTFEEEKDRYVSSHAS
jgi:hypothetical protein